MAEYDTHVYSTCLGDSAINQTRNAKEMMVELSMKTKRMLDDATITTGLAGYVDR